MPDAPQADLHTKAVRADRERQIEDLERRLDEIEALDESDIGGFTALDWFFCITGSVIIPAIALWWFAG
jgi:hypothetical protein